MKNAISKMNSCGVSAHTYHKIQCKRYIVHFFFANALLYF